MGATQAQVEQQTAHCQVDDVFYVTRKAWNVVVWFLDVAHLMKYSGKACLGLDVLSVEADARMSKRNVCPNDFKLLTCMGIEAAHCINNKRQS